MMKKLDKFSVFVGACLVLLIIGCVAQVGSDSDARLSRYKFHGEVTQSRQNWNMDGQPGPAFGILDRETGTFNVWYENGTVVVHEFEDLAP